MSPSLAPGSLGFDPYTRSWGTATEQCPPFVGKLDGTLAFDTEAVVEAGRDLGRLRTAAPAAVLQPGSVTDIRTVVARCAELSIPVAAQGAAHTVGGQRLVEDGIAIDMTRLATVTDADFAPDLSYVDVPAGMLWSDLVPLLGSRDVQFAGGYTGYLGLSTGGTLAVGGISNMPSLGAQVDHVLEMDVVIGTGELVTCSPTLNSRLFDAARAGLGQVGIVTRARLELVPAPAEVASAVVPYATVEDAIDGARIANRLNAERNAENNGQATAARRDDEVFIMVMPPLPGTPRMHNLHLACYGPTGADDLQRILDRLPEWHVPSAGDVRAGERAPAPAGAVTISVVPLTDHLFTFTRVIDSWRRDADWDARAKPWFDAWLSNGAIAGFARQVLDSMTAADWSDMGFVLLFPHRRRAFGSPMLMLPEPTDRNDPDEECWLFDILNVAAPDAPSSYGPDMQRRNLAWTELAYAAGGTVYPIGLRGIETPDFWIRHYGDRWPEMQAAKKEFDPVGILTPGPGMPRD